MDEIAADAAEDQVVAISRGFRVLARRSVQAVVALLSFDQVAAGTTVKRVVLSAAEQLILPRFAVKLVGPGHRASLIITVELIVVGASVNQVIVGPAE